MSIRVKKASCRSPSNIAFIKYWGKADPMTRIPQNNSISMCLSGLYSRCTVEFSGRWESDTIRFLSENSVAEEEKARIAAVLDRVRKLAKTDLRAKVVTMNNFPKATGIASSASGLSAVTVAACAALGVKLTQGELARLARLASGTATRSIPDGFVEWRRGVDERTSCGVQLFPPDQWAISDVVAIVTKKMKKVSSSDGHQLANTSPFQPARQRDMSTKIRLVKNYLKEKRFREFGQLIEAEALNMHAICLTSRPPILYWEGTTMTIMRKVQVWREQGLEVYFTIDAGPSVHVICQKKDNRAVSRRLRRVPGVERVVINHPGIGARVTTNHLF